ncbi:MAG TPA: patatin-like phospholipase family protein [Casimicrobiaceae bacterium]|nr:patatin-like phospholipase family protein [Casimicrobiaceae bacterium]
MLSGGGARGAAHIGVLKVIEELRVPIDCIAGTSMGSIVGAAYAGGMSIDEMQKAIGQISSRALFTEKLPRQEQAIRRKLDDRSILFGLELGLRDGDFHLPKGAITGVQLETVLRGLVKAEGYRRFDELPIRYRAVATDLVTGRAVVFDHGELANVMRASMSVPGVIAPAEIDGMILVDGGLTDNLPVDVARAMGADVVIAVNLGTPLMKRDELTSVLGVTAQMINILTEQNVRASLASLRPGDILIEPELGDFSAADFDDLPKTIPIGVAAARKVAERLAALSLPAEEYAALRHRQLTTVVADQGQVVDEIRFNKMAHVNPDAMQALVQTQPGQPIDQRKLDRDMLRLFGTGDFEHVNYRLLEEAGRRVLNIDAVEKSWGPNYLRFGLGLGSDLQGDAFFNIAASYRRTWINSLGGEWRSDVQMGRTTRLYTELYQPLNVQGHWFVAPSAELERSSVDLFQGSQRIARYKVRNANGELDLGANLGPYGEVRLGYLGGAVNASLDTGPDELAPPNDRISQGALVLRGVVDQLDNANFPRSGYAGTAHVFASRGSLGATDDYTKWDADFIGAYSIDRHTFHVALKGGGAIGSGDLPRYDLFQWGGFLQQSGYPLGALLGERLAFGRFVYTYKLLDRTFLDGVYAGVSLEAGHMGRPLVSGSPTGVLKSSAVFLGFDTLIGPLYIGYGRAADGNQSGYLYLGRP